MDTTVINGSAEQDSSPRPHQLVDVLPLGRTFPTMANIALLAKSPHEPHDEWTMHVMRLLLVTMVEEVKSRKMPTWGSKL